MEAVRKHLSSLSLGEGWRGNSGRSSLIGKEGRATKVEAGYTANIGKYVLQGEVDSDLSEENIREAHEADLESFTNKEGAALDEREASAFVEAVKDDRPAASGYLRKETLLALLSKEGFQVSGTWKAGWVKVGYPGNWGLYVSTIGEAKRLSFFIGGADKPLSRGEFREAKEAYWKAYYVFMNRRIEKLARALCSLPAFEGEGNWY